MCVRERERERTRERDQERERESPHLVRNLLVLLQEHIELTDTYSEISISELVGNVEA